MPLNSPNVTNANRDFFLSTYLGEAIEITSLPIGIKNAVYRVFFEGYTFSFNQYEMMLSLITTDYTYSMSPTRWQDVVGTLTWAAVGATIQWYTYGDS